MSDPIIHEPLDLGVGFELTDKSLEQVIGLCFLQSCNDKTTLMWELRNAPTSILLIQFEETISVRLQDETWTSIETSSDRWVGIDGSFARTVSGGEYPTDKKMLEMVLGKAVHYQFVTGSDCVDVVAKDRPSCRLIDWGEQSEHLLRLPRNEDLPDW